MTYFGVTVIGNFKQPRVNDRKHLAVIRKLPSVISGEYPCEACHIRFPDARFDKRPTGMAEKPHDCWVLPMTRGQHIDQHSTSEREFWKLHNIDATALALALYSIWQRDDVKNIHDAETLMRCIVGRMLR